MKQLSTMIGIASAAVALAVVGAQKVDTEIVAGDSVKVGTGQVTLKGLCSTDSKTFTCWKPDGSPAPETAKRVNAFFYGTQQLLALRLGAPSLLLVQETTANVNGQWTSSDQRQLTPLNGSYYTGSYSGAMPTFSYYWYYPDQAQTVTNLTFSTSDSFAASHLLEPKVGSSTTADGVTITITSIKKQTQTVNWNGQEVKRDVWQIGIKRSEEKPQLQYLMLSPLGSDGHQIVMVDAHGKPTPMSRMGTPYFANQMSADQITCTVDPKYIKHLQLTYTLQKSYEFEKVQLQPKVTEVNL